MVESKELYVSPKCQLQCKCSHNFGHTQRNCGHAPRGFACRGSHLYHECLVPREQPQCCSCGGDHMANYHACIRWKDVNAALAKWAPERVQKSAAIGKPSALKSSGARVINATIPSPTPNPIPHQDTEAPKQPKLSKTAKPVPKPTAAPKVATVKPKKPAAANFKTVAPNPLSGNWW
jgi:hypothetical protein